MPSLVIPLGVFLFGDLRISVSIHHDHADQRAFVHVRVETRVSAVSRDGFSDSAETTIELDFLQHRYSLQVPTSRETNRAGRFRTRPPFTSAGGSSRVEPTVGPRRNHSENEPEEELDPERRVRRRTS